MGTNIIQDRGRGPEIAGTRITVYNLLHSLLDPRVTEAELCRIYGLTSEQVAAARAYVLGNAEAVLGQHLRIEERLAAGNPSEVKREAERVRSTFRTFQEWLGKRAAPGSEEDETRGGPHRTPTFREWLAESAGD